MDMSNETPFGNLLQFIEWLEAAKLWYRLLHVRDSIMVTVVVPGYRWEVEFFESGEIEIEQFASTGVKQVNKETLELLVREQAEADNSVM